MSFFQVTFVLLALVSVTAATDYGSSHGGYGKKNVDYSHVPYYNFDWEVQDDYYNDYGQTETRSKDETNTYWRVTLPGKGAHIKRDDQINAKMQISQSYGGSHYGGDNYKSNDYKKY